MKTSPFIIAMCFIGFSSFAQDTIKAKPQHLNEFGIDVTGFLRQFININTSSFPSEPYSPTYYLTYRHHFSCGNFRIGVRADFNNSTIPPQFPNDSNKYYLKTYSLNAFIGWEFYTNLGRHWQVFYGADFRPSLTYYENDYENSNNYYVEGSETQAQIYGIAPFLGIRFKLTKRLSILTETSYAINWEQDMNKTYYTPLAGATSPAPTPVNQKTTKMYSSYSAPLSIFITFAL
jgi:hypothetical protein